MNEIYHYGILGMKWGVRRYQNPDGTLTDSGKRRKKQNILRQTRRDSMSKMSDAELREKVNRLMLEKQYTDLSAPTVKKGESVAKKIVAVAGGVTAVAGGVAAAQKLYKTFEGPIKKIIDDVRIDDAVKWVL